MEKEIKISYKEYVKLLTCYAIVEGLVKANQLYDMPKGILSSIIQKISIDLPSIIKKVKEKEIPRAKC